ncbi:MAG: nucleotidyltransferase substrate binding protein [Algoriphagus sp.]|uniref:nucleotidyltransferase substrate binding protein n=1 Tax=Algoriphagus sp. TaxID=1872435 RepID=UPI00261AD636|nr:nucleotidyltransferase substrate binding protein [Algoriphagus sp.]MDG1278752.1 nucleotidyltransferase substrate binding protein [Algoriphagus sp.]
MKFLPKSCEDCLSEFSTALDDLRTFIKRAKNGNLTEAQSRELIINFEVTHELALKVLTAYFKKEEKGPFTGSRDLTVEAFHADLIDDGKSWLDMIIDRIQYNPIYAIDTQGKFLDNIQKKYLRLLDRFENTMEKKMEA